MKKIILSVKCLILLSCTHLTFAEVLLSKNIFRHVPFSSQYSEDGALIRSVDYRSVNDLIPQIEKQFESLLNGQKLVDRNEAHITVITPPEAKTGFFPGSIGIDKVLPTDKMINLFKPRLQNTTFNIICVGMQKNNKGNIVFYLVVDSSDIIGIRKEVYDIVRVKDPSIPFKPTGSYYPHITIGYIGGDVHGVSKGSETCVNGIVYK